MPELLDHKLTADGYVIRIWLKELGPDEIREYTRAPYKTKLTQQSFDSSGLPIVDEYEPIPWDMTKSQYEQEQVDQAMKLAEQEVAQFNNEPSVISQNEDAIAEQEAANNPELESEE